MERNDVVDILTAITAADRRTVGEADVALWTATLNARGVTSKADCLQAVIEHYANSTQWLMPAHLIERVKAIRAARVGGVTVEAIAESLGIDPDDPDYLTKCQRARAAIADGIEHPRLQAITGGRS